MLRFRKAFIITIALTLALSLAACSSNGSNKGASNKGTSNTGSSNSGSNNSSDDMTEGKIDTSKFVTISYLMLGDKPTNGQLETVMGKVNEILEKKVNAHLELKWIEWADWQTKYNLSLATGETNDLITIGTDWLDTWPNAEKGAFLTLDELLPKYAPMTWDEIPADHWEQSKYNNQIVMIPEDDFTQWVNHGIYYRGDWAEEFGITAPIMDFETLGEYFQGIKDFKEGVIPWDVNGTDSTVGGYINSTTDAIDFQISTGWFPVYWAKSYEERYTAYSPVFDDTFINYAKLMKSWSDKEYWRTDVLNYKGDTRALLRAGTSGADAHHTQTYSGLRPQMDVDQPGSELKMFVYGQERGNLVSMPITHGGTSLGAHSKNPERALMVYDLLRNDEEVYHLFNYGIEGVQYEIKDGKRYRPEGYNDTEHGFSSNFWGGRVDKFEIPSDTTWEGMPQIYAEYDKIKKPFPYGRFVFNKKDIEAEIAALSQVTASLGPAIAWGKVKDPVAAVEELRSKLKAAGYEKVMNEIQRQLDDYKKLVEGN